MKEETAESMLKKSMFLVEANSFEQLSLWQHHAQASPYKDKFTEYSWEQLTGWNVQVGKIGKRPCCININFIRIDGCLVAFYDQCSQVTDSLQTDKWLKKHFKARYNGNRPGTCDAMNFGHCISAIREWHYTPKD